MHPFNPCSYFHLPLLFFVLSSGYAFFTISPGWKNGLPLAHSLSLEDHTMKKRLFLLTTILLPLLIIALAVTHHFRKKQSEEKLALGTKLFEICAQGAEGSRQFKVSKETTFAICGCFAKTVIRHKSLSVAGIVSNPETVKAILEDCGRGHPIR